MVEKINSFLRCNKLYASVTMIFMITTETVEYRMFSESLINYSYMENLES